MKTMTMLPLALIFALTACGEKQTGTAAPDAAQSVAQTAGAAAPAGDTTKAAADGHPGKVVHDANCISCHDSGVYTRADHKMKDFTMLSGQVRRCDANLGNRLSDDEITNVIDYLNSTYYKFPKQ
ncbi:MAG TPA: hypothetical protein PLE99_13740 [Candidatus Thiothrix moscowensis]|uniref:hypothetical protein n=1 Tax=unclassified Thiothrix TaxID=2636184 RepID=UPI001A28ACB7|nr:MULTISPECIES: hypothetical protein [unclassified Thiothrix]MBJ6609784.1 hypothetical protein [Candidatus Thiothrix moscowensis]HRJ53824.1 hypothetical protein [Candidatus Thiothrix moscowensis]HRJ93906.1 hypothetical protein [Candidatus Thiothrix moscowensis]